MAITDVEAFAHLTDADIESLTVELDAIRCDVEESLGAADARYIRRAIAVQRGLEVTGRLLLTCGSRRRTWWAGTLTLALAKVIENMEIGHNVLHGQWDWMRDPKIHSTKWEWDFVSPAKQWKHTHNELHHTYTNVIGRDNDLGYGILRVDEDQKWTLFYLFQPIWHVGNALMFEYSIAAYDLELGGYLAKRKKMSAEDKAKFKAEAAKTVAKIRAQMTKDYLIHPASAAATFGSSGWPSTSM